MTTLPPRVILSERSEPKDLCRARALGQGSRLWSEALSHQRSFDSAARGGFAQDDTSRAPEA
ncbi:MAG: hypothetical protein AAFQ43_13355 [Bacteroidota bacterium]